MKYRDHKYVCTMSFGKLNHQWSLRGPTGGVSFHYSEWIGSDAAEKHAKYGGPSAGLEIHRYAPPDYQKGDAPSHAPCWLLGAPCWHDGTSSYATETVLPEVQAMLPDHPAIFRMLERELESRMGD